jgi:hypothetical protein
VRYTHLCGEVGVGSMCHAGESGGIRLVYDEVIKSEDLSTGIYWYLYMRVQFYLRSIRESSARRMTMRMSQRPEVT